MINNVYREHFKNDTWLREQVNKVLAEGYVLLPDFLEPAFLDEITRFAEDTRGDARTDIKHRSGTPLSQLAHSDEFMAFMNGIHRARCEAEGRPFAPLNIEKQTAGMPYKNARDGARTEETDYHYDGAYVNTTIGLIPPPQGQGELHMFPNFKRKFNNDMVRKIASRVLRHFRFVREYYGYLSVPPVRNTLCLFFGDLSFHGVEPITSGERLIITINSHW